MSLLIFKFLFFNKLFTFEAGFTLEKTLYLYYNIYKIKCSESYITTIYRISVYGVDGDFFLLLGSVSKGDMLSMFL